MLKDSVRHDVPVTALHVDDDCELWASFARRPARKMHHNAAELCDSQEPCGEVRLLGTAMNAKLIVRLLRRALRPGAPFYVALGTPTIVPQHQQPPALITEAVAQSAYFPTSVGGWRRATEDDLAVYRAAVEITKPAPDRELLATLAYSHASWRLASFVNLMEPADYAAWLGHVRDPRWYVSPRHPERSARLQKYMGLWPDLQLTTMLNRPGPYGPQQRCMATRRCWLPDALLRPEQQRAYDCDAPSSFIFRVFRRIMLRPGDATPAVAYVRASQMFVKFARSAWLAMTTKMNGQPTLELMYPEQFFKTQEELQAFQTHQQAAFRQRPV